TGRPRWYASCTLCSRAAYQGWMMYGWPQVLLLSHAFSRAVAAAPSPAPAAPPAKASDFLSAPWLLAYAAIVAAVIRDQLKALLTWIIQSAANGLYARFAG